MGPRPGGGPRRPGVAVVVKGCGGAGRRALPVPLPPKAPRAAGPASALPHREEWGGEMPLEARLGLWALRACGCGGGPVAPAGGR